MNERSEFTANNYLSIYSDGLPKLNPARKAINPPQQLLRATMIRNTLGMRAAAAYMRKHGWSLSGALFHLCGARSLERAALMQLTGV